MRERDLYERELSKALWRSSTYSEGGASCLEVADLGGGAVAVRDSKDPGHGDLRFAGPEWAAFREGVRDGRFG
ncbi:hypothetical protein DWB77_06170 [Streptomyces hundungensis]|uniref:DUF397 domain-containing protein n=1 Tax=Streptomyces hundungensis TaxID=1077946 RepID=A0A387HR40_9ACTN|nr:DUF397 domain-containing protein [Streptomyces hundungensis]AYG83968.1 hypothetical protein DWB77_06170 [Streptomyces hundungensis]